MQLARPAGRRGRQSQPHVVLDRAAVVYQLALIGSDQPALAVAAKVSAEHLSAVLRGRTPCTEDLGRRIAIAIGVALADITRKS